MLDVCIIGAGAAGLGAAKAAHSRGLSYRVLEAASFIGGRARTDYDRLGVPFDVGCRSLYGGDANPFEAYARETGCRLESEPDKTLFFDGTDFLDVDNTATAIADFERLESDLIAAHDEFTAAGAAADRSQADAMERESPAADYFRQAVQIEFTASADEISLADPAHRVLATAGEAVIDGYGALIQRCAGDIPVETSCPVNAIDLSGHGVKVETPKGQIDARTVLLTASTAVLSAGRIALRPRGWPERKLSAIDALPMGSVTQIGLRLADGMLPGELVQVQGDSVERSFVYCLKEAPQCLFWLLGAGQGDLAIAWLGGDFSRDLALQGEDAQADWAIQQLGSLLGNDVKQSVIGSCATPFDREPWIGGGYAYCRFGSGNQRSVFAEPIDDRIYFAGEACSLDHPGTAHGAWLSGIAAIDRIAD